MDAQITAFNRHDLEAFLQTYAFDAVLYGHPDRVLQSGVEEIRVRYAQRFAESPELKAEILNRIVQGDFVIDQERVSGLPGGETLSAVVVYQVRGGKIQRVWFLR